MWLCSLRPVADGCILATTVCALAIQLLVLHINTDLSYIGVTHYRRKDSVIEHARTMLGLAAVTMYLHKINLKLESHNFKQVKYKVTNLQYVVPYVYVFWF
jgi:hypothetical protein